MNFEYRTFYVTYYGPEILNKQNVVLKQTNLNYYWPAVVQLDLGWP